MKCPKCGFENASDAVFCNKCGHRIAEPAPTSSGAQPTAAGGERRHLSDNAGMRAVMPIGRSGVAIAAGYVGIFAITPGVGLVALLLGILAIRHIKNNPGRHGMGRAIFAIVMGAVSTIFYSALMIASI